MKSSTRETKPESKPLLDYAPTPPLFRRRRFRRMVLLIVLLALIYPAWRFGPAVYRQTKMLYLQRRCINYTAPADQVVYDQDSPTTADRLKSPGYVQIPTGWGINAPAALAVAGWIPDQLKDFSGYFPPPVFNGATLFMHERVSKADHRRLLILQRPVVGADYPYYYAFGIHVILFYPATLNKMPVLVFPRRTWQPISWPALPNPPPTKGLRFYAGQIDPADEARFTIRYELDGKSGLIEGRLTDPGDDIILRVLDGPALGTQWVTEVLP